MAVIIEPNFPPIGGMIEDIDENGNPVLIKSPVQKEKEGTQSNLVLLTNENKLLKTQIKALSDNNTYVTECLMEMSCEVYK
jgi:hypothetical protein